MIASNQTEYFAMGRADARKVVSDPALCAEKPHLRALAWRVLTGRGAGPATLRLTASMRIDHGPEDAA